MYILYNIYILIILYICVTTICVYIWFHLYKILEDAVVNYSIIDEKVIVGKGAKVGSEIADKVEIAVIGRELKIEDYAIVKAGANIEHDVIREKEDK